MAELIRAFELLGKGLQTAQSVGKFVVGHVRGGAWSELPHVTPLPSAHIEVISTTPDNIIKSEE